MDMSPNDICLKERQFCNHLIKSMIFINIFVSFFVFFFFADYGIRYVTTGSVIFLYWSMKSVNILSSTVIFLSLLYFFIEAFNSSTNCNMRVDQFFLCSRRSTWLLVNGNMSDVIISTILIITSICSSLLILCCFLTAIFSVLLAWLFVLPVILL